MDFYGDLKRNAIIFSIVYARATFRNIEFLGELYNTGNRSQLRSWQCPISLEGGQEVNVIFDKIE